LTVGLWLSWTVVAPRREVRRSYVDDAVSLRIGQESFGQMIARRVATNATLYGGSGILAEFRLPLLRNTRLDNVAWFVVLGTLGVIGFAVVFRTWNAAAWYVVWYMSLLVVWPFYIERFLDPVLPFVTTMFVVGAWTLGDWLRPGTGLGARVAAALGVVLLGSAAWVDRAQAAAADACAHARAACATPDALDFMDAAHYVTTHTEPNALFIVPKSPTFYYVTQRKSMFWDEVIVQDSSSFLPYLDRNDVRYILTTPVLGDYVTVVRLASAHCTQFDLMKAFSRYTLLLARRSVPSDGNSAACRALARASVIGVGHDGGD
jgi:hypothetical protein